MHCSKKGQRLFLLSLSCSLFIWKGKQAQKRDWARAEDLAQWCCCTVRVNAMESCPQEHSSLPSEKPGGCFWAQGLLGHMNHCFASCGNTVSSTTAVGSVNHVDWAPAVGCWGLTTSCQCRATLEANRQGFQPLERAVALEFCST